MTGDDYSRIRMSFAEKKRFSNIMLENALAAYHGSMLDVMLEAPFHSTSEDDWNEQYKLMLSLQSRLKLRGVFTLGQTWFLKDFEKNWQAQSNRTLVPENLFVNVE